MESEKEINNNDFDYVDLGRPSGTLWAKCNVGASNPLDYGLYFQWGDIKGYTKEQIGKVKQFTWDDYKFNPSGDGYTFTKYATKGETLDLEDDAANTNMGGSWHMPTPEQIQELIDNTTKYFTIREMKLVSKKDESKYIFFPCGGFSCDGSADKNGGYGSFWTSMLDEDYVNYGNNFYFNSKFSCLDGFDRFNGSSVRGVIG